MLTNRTPYSLLELQVQEDSAGEDKIHHAAEISFYASTKKLMTFTRLGPSKVKFVIRNCICQACRLRWTGFRSEGAFHVCRVFRLWNSGLLFEGLSLHWQKVGSSQEAADD